MTDLRELLKKGFIVKAKNIDGYEFEILDEFARGGSSVIYTACGRDGTVLIKELFPVNGYCRTNGKIQPVNSVYPDLSERASRMNGEHNIGKILTLKSAWVEKIGNPFESFEGNYYSVIYESRPGATLKQFLSLDETDNISLRAWIEMIHRLAWVIKDLHDEKIVHLDISPGNIRLINNNDEETLIKAVASHNGSSATLQYGVTLIDFGCSLELNSFNEAVKPFYSPTTGGYSAPELYIDGSGIVTPAADVFSVCACLKSCISKISREEYSNLPITVTTKLDEILERGLAEDPMYRFKNIDSLIKELSELLLLIDGKGINKTVIWEASKRDYAQKLHTRFKDSKAEDIIDEMWSYAKCDIDKGEYGKLNIRQIMSKYKDRNCLIVGDGGMGKTTLLVSLLHDVFSNDKKYDSEKAVPVFVELNKAPDDINVFAEKGNKESSFILRYIACLLLNVDYTEVSDETLVALRKEFTKSVGEPEYVFLLDGLNEVSGRWVNEADDSVQGIIVKEINDIVKKFNNVRFIITTRDENNGIGDSCFELIYLNGLSKEMAFDWLESHNFKENIEEIKEKADLVDCLCVPLFLLMYSKIKPFNADISSQGELLRAFWNEKSQSYSQYQVAKNKKTDAVRRDMSVEQHRFIVDFIVPELCYYMLLEQDFEINSETAKQHISNVLAKFTSEPSEYKILQRAFESYSVPKGKYWDNIIDVVRAFDKLEDCEKRILVEIENIGVFVSYKRNADIFYEIRHQHFRDYFAAVHIINGLRVATEFFESNERDFAFKTINALLKETVYNTNIYRLIGEYLGEHKNRPYYEDEEWHYGVPEEKCDRNLIKRALDIYRGYFNGECGYGVYSLVEILKFVRQDLSGADFSKLDLCYQNLNGICLSRLGVVANFQESKISSATFMPMGHNGAINSVCCSKDGRTIVTASEDCTAKIWDKKTLRTIAVLSGHQKDIYSVCFSPDDKIIATASWDKTVKLWDSKSFKEIGVLKGHSSFVNSVSFSIDGIKIVTASDDMSVKVWDTKTLQEIKSLFGHTSCVYSVCFSPDGQKIASASRDNTVKIWDANTYDELGTLEGHTKSVNSVFFNADNKTIITASDDKTVKIWDAKEYKEIASLNKHKSGVLSACFSPSGKYILSSSYDETVMLWDAMSYKCYFTLTGHKNFVRSVCMDSDEKTIITASNDKTVKIWDAKTGRLIKTSTPNEPKVFSACYSPDGKNIVVAAADKLVKIWDKNLCKLTGVLIGHKDWVKTAFYNNTGDRIITASSDARAIVWDAKSGNIMSELSSHKSCVFSAGYSPNGKYIATVSDDETVKIWNGNSFKEVYMHPKVYFKELFKGKTHIQKDLNLESDLWDAAFKVWNKELNQMLDKLLKKHIGKFSYSVSGTKVVTSGDSTYPVIWDIQTGQKIGAFKYRVNSASFNPDGKFIVTANSDGTIKTWSTKSFRCIKTIINIPGLLAIGIDLRNLHPDSYFNDEDKDILRKYGANID